VLPLLNALRPRLTVVVTQDGEAVWTAAFADAAAWGGRVETRTDDWMERLGDADLVIFRGDRNWWTVHSVLETLALGGKALPVVLVHGTDEHTPHSGVLTAIDEFLAERKGLTSLSVPGFGGLTIVASLERLEAAPQAFTELLEALRLAPAIEGHVAALAAHAAELTETLTLLREREVEQQAKVTQGELDGYTNVELRDRLRSLTEVIARQRMQLIDAELRAARAEQQLRASGPPVPDAGSFPEPSVAEIRELLAPEQLLDALGWSGPTAELAGPIPIDLQRRISADGQQCVAVIVGSDPLALRRSICSIIDRALDTCRVVLVGSAVAPDLIGELAQHISRMVPGVELAARVPADADLTLECGQELAWGWPADVTGQHVSVAYVLTGLAPEGSGGSHSIVNEARGLIALGAAARVCVPESAIANAHRLYGDGDGLFSGFAGADGLAETIGDATIAISTDFRCPALLARLCRARGELAAAYYVQDYEPLFTPAGSEHADEALLSYRAVPDQRLFAKSHWLRNIVAARHGVPVAKVTASLGPVFNSVERRQGDRTPTVAAMIRPRTPRRRPGATFQALAQIEYSLGDGVRTVTFGCDDADASPLAKRAGSRAEHLGVLDNRRVADLLRGCDVFVDASTYQAFGRTGLEAMACGAVPVLPRFGGVSEYAVHGINALISADDSPAAIAAAVVNLLADPDLLERMRIAGRERASEFTIESAARAQLGLFSVVLAERERSTTVLELG
jgi:hypothetical protein